MEVRQEPVLNPGDRQSSVWKKLKAHMEERIESLRARNDRHHDERKTAQLRCSIAELQHLISLGEDRLLPPPEDGFKD